MRRKVFFFLEKLEIKRSERIAVTLLFGCLTVLSCYLGLSEPGTDIKPDQYAESEAEFERRSRLIQQEENAILARYRPGEANAGRVPDIRESNGISAALPDTVEEPPDKVQTRDGTPDLINVNTASAEELQKLPGIGPAYSERIVEWREKNGTFTSKEELMEIKGIGEKRLEDIRPLIEL